MLIKGPLLELEKGFSEATSNNPIKIACTEILDRFDSVSLSELRGTKLMRRTDTKYLFQEEQLPQILENLSADYDVLSVGGVRIQHYLTRYYDTPDFTFYRQHHNGQRDRFKLRVRSYLDSDLSFLEVKRKDNLDRTQKSRLETPYWANHNSPDVASFLEYALPEIQPPLVPKITNQFYRIALVSKHDRERLSLDLDLRFLSPSGQFSLPGIVVAEVKQPYFSVHASFIQKMREANYRPTSFSKYCIGVALAYPNLKRNAFKPLLLEIQQLVVGGAA